MPLDISIIIVNYNTENFIVRSLRSIEREKEITFEVIVIDNNSEDNSIAVIKKNFPRVNLICNPENSGFARANNLAFARSTGKYVFFLNPDTEVKPDSLKIMKEYMDSHPRVGLAGTRLVFPDNSAQSSVETSYPGSRHAKSDLKDLPGEIAWVLGASMIARNSIIKEINGFDERYFLYGEDIDLCLCIRKKGWEIGFIPNAVIVHWEGQSETNTPLLAVFQKKLMAAQIFFNKHYSKRSISTIKRLDILQAVWRIFTLFLTIPFAGNKKKQKNKLAQYQLILKMCRSKK